MDSQKQEYHLLQVEDDNGKRTYYLNSDTVSIGRDSSNAILIHDPCVSRQHAILRRLPAQDLQYSYQIVDGDHKGQHSKNGLWVNQMACQHKTLAAGDLIQIGSTLLCYIIAWMTTEEYKQYFDAQTVTFHCFKDEVIDPTGTLVEDLYAIA